MPSTSVQRCLQSLRVLGTIAWAGWLLVAGDQWALGAERLNEYQVKAAFLFNFGKFVEWPKSVSADTKTPFVVGILGEDPFGSVMDSLTRGKSINDRPLVVRRLSTGADPSGCHILFISRSEKERLAAILAELDRKPILTVSESTRFAESGGMINFVVQNETVKLEINPVAATGAGLKIRSNLLSLAKIIGTSSPGESKGP